MTNDKTSTAIFLYPDLVTALTGAINSEGTGLSSGAELTVCRVMSLGVESGILLPGLIKTGQSLPVTSSRYSNNIDEMIFYKNILTFKYLIFQVFRTL